MSKKKNGNTSIKFIRTSGKKLHTTIRKQLKVIVNTPVKEDRADLVHVLEIILLNAEEIEEGIKSQEPQA